MITIRSIRVLSIGNCFPFDEINENVISNRKLLIYKLLKAYPLLWFRHQSQWKIEPLSSPLVELQEYLEEDLRTSDSWLCCRKLGPCLETMGYEILLICLEHRTEPD